MDKQTTTTSDELIETKDDKNFLLELPDEILLNIFHYLDFKSVARAGQTCSRLSSLSQDEQVWKHLLIKDFSNQETDEDSFKDISSQEIYSTLYKKKNKLPLLWWARSMAEQKNFSIYSIIPPVLIQHLSDNGANIQM